VNAGDTTGPHGSDVKTSSDSLYASRLFDWPALLDPTGLLSEPVRPAKSSLTVRPSRPFSSRRLPGSNGVPGRPSSNFASSHGFASSDIVASPPTVLTVRPSRSVRASRTVLASRRVRPFRPRTSNGHPWPDVETNAGRTDELVLMNKLVLKHERSWLAEPGSTTAWTARRGRGHVDRHWRLSIAARGPTNCPNRFFAPNS